MNEPAPVVTREAARRLTVLTFQPEDLLAEPASLLAEASEMNRRGFWSLTLAHGDMLLSSRDNRERQASY